MKVRVTASITKSPCCGYRVILTNGIFGDFATLQDAKDYADKINDDDSNNPLYIEIEDSNESEYNGNSIPYYERIDNERKEREEKKRAIEDSNRKSNKADDKYIFIISCYLRGERDVVYIQGETDIAKITKKYGGGFITAKAENAKTFQTKAKAQRFIDKISSSWIIDSLFRSMKVVRRKK